MTTGRINQVTIVRRGWPSAPCGAEELVTVLTPLGAGGPAVEARPAAPGDAFRFSPLRSPGRRSATRAARWGRRWGLQVPRGDLRLAAAQSTEPIRRRPKATYTPGQPIAHPGLAPEPRGSGAPGGSTTAMRARRRLANDSLYAGEITRNLRRGRSGRKLPYQRASRVVTAGRWAQRLGTALGDASLNRRIMHSVRGGAGSRALLTLKHVLRKQEAACPRALATPECPAIDRTSRKLLKTLTRPPRPG
ncbi:hypothetical protein F4781DRAFT_438249 [Annulohypoxylon bovei var. microspora]|nr:hypothetical protein F4781DRAFT_438249 [Annulohypoxylon bovei var. microspora]